MIDHIWFTIQKGECGRYLVQPYKATREQLAIFRHCANDMVAVTQTYFDQTVVPLLKQHGIVKWDFFKEGEETLMANPLQPKCINVLEKEYYAFVINLVSSSKGGMMDLVASIPKYKRIITQEHDIIEETLGIFYGFEIKWKNDQPSELQKQKINACIDAGGRAYFIKSVDQLRSILDNNRPPIKYPLKNNLIL